MKKNRTFIIIIVILLSTFLSGCKGPIDINKRTIVTCVLLDKKDGQIYMYAEFANIQGGVQMGQDQIGKSNKFSYYVGKGESIVQARFDLGSKLINETYLSSIRSLIFTEAFAKDHILEYLYRTREDETYRKKIFTTITNQDPLALFKVNHSMNKSLGYEVEDLINSLKNDGKTFIRTTARIIENFSDEYTGILLPCIGIKDDAIRLDGYTVAFDSSIVGFIPIEDSKGVIYLKEGKGSKFIYTINYENTDFAVEVTEDKKTIKPLYKDGEISFDVKLRFRGNLQYGNTKTPYDFNDSKKKDFSNMLQELIKNDVMKAIELSQGEFNCDYFQFDDEFRIKYPDIFIELNWEEAYKKATVNVEVEVCPDKMRTLNYESKERR